MNDNLAKEDLSVDPVDTSALSGKQLTLVIDSSISMVTPDAAPGKTRYQAALEAAEALKRAFTDRMDIRLLSFTNRTTETTLEDLRKNTPQGEVTNLAAGISKTELNHAEVVEYGKKAESSLQTILTGLVADLS